jgi:transposase
MSQIITNEVVHYQGLEERWEIKIVREIWDRQKLEEWDRAYLRKFLQAEGWKADKHLETKITRLINKWNDWGLLNKDYNRFSLKHSELFENDASL